MVNGLQKSYYRAGNTRAIHLNGWGGGGLCRVRRTVHCRIYGLINIMNKWEVFYHIYVRAVTINIDFEQSLVIKLESGESPHFSQSACELTNGRQWPWCFQPPRHRDLKQHHSKRPAKSFIIGLASTCRISKVGGRCFPLNWLRSHVCERNCG